MGHRRWAALVSEGRLLTRTMHGGHQKVADGKLRCRDGGVLGALNATLMQARLDNEGPRHAVRKTAVMRRKEVKTSAGDPHLSWHESKASVKVREHERAVLERTLLPSRGLAPASRDAASTTLTPLADTADSLEGSEPLVHHRPHRRAPPGAAVVEQRQSRAAPGSVAVAHQGVLLLLCRLPRRRAVHG